MHIWDVHRLIRQAAKLTPFDLPLDRLEELDTLWWFRSPSDPPTPRAIAAHVALVQAADLSHPIVLCADGRLMDGMHRAVKALAMGRDTIPAVRFPKTPPPDFVNMSLDDLPYPDEKV